MMVADRDLPLTCVAPRMSLPIGHVSRTSAMTSPEIPTAGEAILARPAWGTSIAWPNQPAAEGSGSTPLPTGSFGCPLTTVVFPVRTTFFPARGVPLDTYVPNPPIRPLSAMASW